MPKPHTTFAQNLWRQVIAGRQTPEEALQTFSMCSSDVGRQIETMPDDMFLALQQFMIRKRLDGPAISSAELHALNFDIEAAMQNALARLDLIDAAIQQRLQTKREAKD